MNLARVGVVCGVDDGAPAILTEYMLAGLPVLANERLACGLQFITPQTGRAVRAEDFGKALVEILDRLEQFDPRGVALGNWTWASTVRQLVTCLENVSSVKAARNKR